MKADSERIAQLEGIIRAITAIDPIYVGFDLYIKKTDVDTAIHSSLATVKDLFWEKPPKDRVK